jgi:hypothetical protein
MVAPDFDVRLRATHERLDRAINAYHDARRKDNATKTPATKQAREVALRAMIAAEHAHGELLRRAMGL